MMQFDRTKWVGNGRADPQRMSDFLWQLTDFVIANGAKALDAMENISYDRRLLDQVVEAGLLRREGAGYRLTPAAVVAMQRTALLELSASLGADSARPSPALVAPPLGLAGQLLHRQRFGDPIGDAELTALLKNALVRNGSCCPLQIEDRDLDNYLRDCRTSAAVAVLLDMNASMGRFGRFVQAKKVILALAAVMQHRYDGDSLDVIGF